MIALRDSIKQLIELTEQQLLENKKQELLSMLPQESPPSSPVARGGLISEGPYFGLILKTKSRNYRLIARAPFHFLVEKFWNSDSTQLFLRIWPNSI